MTARKKIYLCLLTLALAGPAQLFAGDEDLLSTNVETRKKAMIALKSAKDFSRIETLLKSDKFAYRKAATFALREFTPEKYKEEHEKACNILIAALEDKSPIIRFEVAQNLVIWGRNEGNTVMINNLEHTNSLRRLRAARALYTTADPRSIPYLVGNLRDDEFDIRKSSIETLRKITGEFYGYNPTDPSHVVLSKVDQISLRTKYKELFDGLGDATGKEATEQANKANAAYNEACEKVMRVHIAKYSTIRENAIANWRDWWIDNKEGKRLEWLKKSLEHSNPATRQLAIKSIKQLNAVETHDAIAKIINEDDDVNVVVTACDCLAYFNKKESIPHLIQLLKTTAGADKSDQKMNQKNFAAYKTLKLITQADFTSLITKWEGWWKLYESEFTVGVDLPTKKGHNIRIKSIDGETVTFIVKFYYDKRKAWVVQPFTVKKGEQIGKRNTKETFIDEDDLQIDRYFDMRSGIYLDTIGEDHVVLKTPDQNFKKDGESFTIKGNVYKIKLKK